MNKSSFQIRKKTVLIVLLLNFFFNPFIVFSQSINNDSISQLENEITSSTINWLIYQQDNISWSSNFIAYDFDNKIISKEYFYEKLISGKYFLIKIGTTNDSNMYQLRKADNARDKEILDVVKSRSILEFNYYKWEGKYLPELNFEDISGNKLTSMNTNGKILVINCWFTNCGPCVAEIPELNKLVKYFRADTSVIFLALAFDDKKSLETFLKNKRFDYTIIPGKEDYLRNILKISLYPTHIIVDKNGKIKKITNSNLNTLKQLILNEQ